MARELLIVTKDKEQTFKDFDIIDITQEVIVFINPITLNTEIKNYYKVGSTIIVNE